MQVSFTHTLLLHPPNNLNREAFYRSWDWGSQKFLAWEHWAEIPVSRFRVLLLNSTALVGKLILVSLGRTRLPRDAYNLMHYPVRKCSVPVLKPFQGLLPFFLRAILLLVTIYFFFHVWSLFNLTELLHWHQEIRAFKFSALYHAEFILSFIQDKIWYWKVQAKK